MAVGPETVGGRSSWTGDGLRSAVGKGSCGDSAHGVLKLSGGVRGAAAGVYTLNGYSGTSEVAETPLTTPSRCGQLRESPLLGLPRRILSYR